MGLGHAPDLIMRISDSSQEGRPDLGGVMGIVIYDGNAVKLSLVFKAPAGA